MSTSVELLAGSLGIGASIFAYAYRLLKRAETREIAHKRLHRTIAADRQR